MAGEDVFWRCRRSDFVKDRATTGDPRVCRVRQMKGVVHWQEHAEDLGAADYRDTAVRRAERFGGLFQRAARGIP